MERRRAERVDRKLTCELIIAGRRHPGTILDLSPLGLFVQTAASPPPGEKVRVRMLNADETCTEISAVVARRHVVPRRLASVANSGIGLRIESGFAELERFAESCPPLQENASPRVAEMLPAGPAAEEISYRVRARQVAGTHSKTLRVTAESEEKARSLALSSLDYGWEILSVDPVGN